MKRIPKPNWITESNRRTRERDGWEEREYCEELWPTVCVCNHTEREIGRRRFVLGENCPKILMEAVGSIVELSLQLQYNNTHPSIKVKHISYGLTCLRGYRDRWLEDKPLISINFKQKQENSNYFLYIIYIFLNWWG